MKILVTGASGFIGKNLILELKNNGYTDIVEFDTDSDYLMLEKYCREVGFIFHLAGVNRPDQETQFMEGNADFIVSLIDILIKYDNPCPILYSSSTQAAQDNPYGRSKKAGEDALLFYSKKTNAKVLIYRFSNVFGKWCRPNYNSVVATFCYNIANELPIIIREPERLINLVYINDLTKELLRALRGEENKVGSFCEVPVVYSVTLEQIASLIHSFRDDRKIYTLPNLSNNFIKKLYSTYLTYLPEQQLCYELKMNSDNRGSFTEFMKQPQLGQLSVNILKHGIIKGNHWHNTKHEKFLVVSGAALIRLRKINVEQVIEFSVSSSKLTLVEIPSGYVHSIKNLGDTDMVVIIWANEAFDPNNPDTFYMEV
jgi:UDP-2-acetamido-2,6-beta-L-arabino-hexul-4-ose reductase